MARIKENNFLYKAVKNGFLDFLDLGKCPQTDISRLSQKEILDYLSYSRHTYTLVTATEIEDKKILEYLFFCQIITAEVGFFFI